MADEKFTSRDEAICFGHDYEYLMAAYYGFVFSLNDGVKDFKMSTNNKTMGDFDDVVLEVALDGGEEHVFALQLKHVERQVARVTLVNKNKKFSLQKYGREFGKIQASCDRSRSYAAPFENFHFVLFTTSNLENCEEFTEEWKKLEPHVGGSILESDVLIKKCDRVFGQELVSLPASGNSPIFRFKSAKADSTDERFFQQFYFYTEQMKVKEVECLIADLFTKNFKHCDSAAPISYVNYINFWYRGDYGPYKLTKKDVCMKIAELIFTKYIPEVDILNLNYSPDESFSAICTMFVLFDIVIMKDRHEEATERIWTSILQEFITTCKNHSIDWSTPVPSLYISAYEEKLSIPISAYSENFNEISMKKTYLLFWHLGTAPLVLNMPENPTHAEDISKAITLCKNNNAECKFVLLGESSCLKEETDWKILRNLSDLFNHSRLIYSSIEKITVSLQGRPWITLKEFVAIDQDLMNAITTKEILLMMDNNYVIGTDCTKTLPKYYVERSIPKLLMDVNILNEVKSELFVVDVSSETKIENCTTDSVELEKYLLLKESGYPMNLSKRNSGWFFITAKGGCSRQRFEEICASNGNVNCHHVCLIDKGRMEWIESEGSVANLQKYRLNPETFQPNDFVKDSDALAYFSNRTNVICAEPGMGKTVIMNFLQVNCPSQYWVVNVQLRKHVTLFKKPRHKEDILRYFLALETDNGVLLEKIVDVLASKRQILFLWDGFDEVPSEHRNSVVAAIKVLAGEGYLNWISARLNSKALLEDAFKTLSLTLTHYNQQNQYDYVYRHLIEKYKDEEKVEKLIDRINENISSLLKCGHVDYTGIPLQMQMLTEIYLDRDDEERNLTFVTIADIYQEFILEKFNGMFQKAEADLDNLYMQVIRDQYVNVQLDLYETAAVKTALGAEDLADVSLNCGSIAEELEENEDALGLVSQINEDGTVLFAHKTYEEFLAASWLSKHGRRYPRLVRALFDEQYDNIRTMFDLLLAKDSPVHLAVIYRNLEVLRDLQENIETSKDLGGRNALHVACSWGQRHPLVRVMEKDEKIQTVERSREDNFAQFQNSVSFLKQLGINIPEVEKIKSHDSRMFDETNERLSQMFRPTSDNYQSDVPNTLQINAQNLTKINEEEIVFLEILEYLLTHNCDIHEKDDLLEWNALQYADHSLSLAAIDLLMKFHRIKLDVLENFNHIPTVVHYSVIFLYDNLLEALEEIPFVEYQYQCGRVTLLQLAAETNNLFAVSKMLKHSYYERAVNTEGAFLNNPLGSAVFRGNLEMVNVLLESGADVNGYKFPPLMGCSASGRTDICRKLLEAGAEVNAASALNGDSPLLTSIKFRQFDITRLLLENDADVNYINNDCSALALAVGINSSTTVELILQHGPDVNHQCESLGYTPLHTATEFGFGEIVKTLLKLGADASIKSKRLLTPLCIALYNKHEDIALELVDACPGVANDYDEDGLSPVMLAAMKNLPDVLEVFAKHGADFACSEAEVSPLCYAALHNFDACVRALIEGGAPVNQATSNGMYPIMFSVGEKSTLQIFLSNSADISVKDTNGVSALHYAINKGSKECVEELITSGASVNGEYDIPSNLSKTPLYFAIYNKRLEMLEILLDHGAEVGSGPELINAALAMDFSEAIPLLVEKGVDINAKDKLGLTPLYNVILESDATVQTSFDKAEMLLKHGADPDVTYQTTPLSLLSKASELLKSNELDKLFNMFPAEREMTHSPLHLAAAKGNILITVLLVAHGANVNITDQDLQTPLHYACSYLETTQTLLNKEDCLKELLAKGALVNSQSVEGRTPLHLACLDGNSNAVKILLENETTKIDLLDKQGRSPLHYCFGKGKFETADILIQHGAELNLEDAFGVKPADYGVEWIITQDPKNFDVRILKSLHGLGANLNQPSRADGNTLLHFAVAENNTEEVKFLVETGVDVNQKNHDGWSAVYYACVNDNVPLMKILQEAGADLSVESSSKDDLLAVSCQHASVLRHLVDSGLSVNHRNENNVTPLYNACARNNYDGALLLIENGAEVNAATRDRNVTPLNASSSQGCGEIVRLLLRSDASVMVKRDGLVTAPVEAAITNRLEILKLFVETLAEGRNGILHRNEIDSEWKHCLVYAAGFGHLAVVRFLHENGLAQLDDQIENGVAAMLEASAKGKLDVVKYLIENNAEVNTKANNGFDPLYEAASGAHLDVVQLLVNAGAEINSTNSNGNTPLCAAAARGFLEIVRYLRDNGADVDVIDNDGDTPLHDAACRGHFSVVQYLLSQKCLLNHKNHNRKTALDLALENEHMEIVEFLKRSLDQSTSTASADC